jgi:hypothetical protein
MLKNIELFESFHYQRHNRRRQEHLASLGLPISGKTVLEVGAGIGDHTSFFIDRGCSVTSSDGRPELLEVLKQNNPKAAIHEWNVEHAPPVSLQSSEIVYAYGLLYHTKAPDIVLTNLSNLCKELLLLETCVSFGDSELICNIPETLDDPTQALFGLGCRPTRSWVFAKLKTLFPYVYVTRTQPFHEEFPIDWTYDEKQDLRPGLLSRSVFVASRVPINNLLLSDTLLSKQVRL